MADATVDNIRLRVVEYSENYLADHWCQKGHILHCREGEVISELENLKRFILKKGCLTLLLDDLSFHRSISKDGVKFLIIDGAFLQSK